MRYHPGNIGHPPLPSEEHAPPAININQTLDWNLALHQAAGKADLAREMLEMLLEFLPEVRNTVEEQLVGDKPEGLVEIVHKLHGSCSYSGVPRMKKLCQTLEHGLRSGMAPGDLEPEMLELLDEMDNVVREAKKYLSAAAL